MSLNPLEQGYLHEAYQLAVEAAARDEVPVGAVMVHDGKVVGRGSNTREELQDPTGHAEMTAIREAAKSLSSWRLIDCDLYVTLEPCPMCLSACQQARVRRVVYGAKDEKGGAICLGFHTHNDSRLNHQFEVVYEPSDECSQVLKDFFSKRRTEQKAAKGNS
jgi:tRNA(adenine34) deaminase